MQTLRVSPADHNNRVSGATSARDGRAAAVARIEATAAATVRSAAAVEGRVCEAARDAVVQSINDALHRGLDLDEAIQAAVTGALEVGVELGPDAARQVDRTFWELGGILAGLYVRSHGGQSSHDRPK